MSERRHHSARTVIVHQTPGGDIIRGRSRIAAMLDISVKSLSRRLKEGHFPEIFRFGPNRSELRITREDLEMIRRRGITERQGVAN